MKQFLALFLSVFAFGLMGCMQDEEYTTSPDARLTFSTDTLSFDTVISGLPTGTQTFTVYNPNKKGVRIAKVELVDGSNFSFRVNADGSFLEGGSVSDLEIWAKDSLRIFVEMTAPVNNADEPSRVEDKLRFVTEGGVQAEVVLSAFGQDVIPMKGLVIETDSVFSARRPYQIFDSLVVAPGATLTLEAGVRLYFHPDASLIVHGKLIANGAINNEVMLRGDRLGNMFSNQPYDRIPGQWGGILFTEGSYGNQMNYVDIHSGKYGIRCDSADVSREKLRLENSVVHNTSTDAVYLESSRVFFGNSCITNAGGNCLTIVGGSHEFVHCTIANFYVFTGGRGNALNFSNFKGAVPSPLEAANFKNCFITGYAEDEIMGNRMDDETVAFNYVFTNCLLCTPAYESESIVDCFWDTDDFTPHREGNFEPFDLDKLTFSFLPLENSQVVGNADVGITETYYPLDRNGVERLADGNSDMGCYECVQNTDAGASGEESTFKE